MIESSIRPTVAGASAFFDACLARVQDRGIAPILFDLDLAGDRIRLAFSSAELARILTRSMGHLEAPSEGTPGLVLHVLDSGSARVPIPLPPWTDEIIDGSRPRGEIEPERILYRDERYLMYFHRDAEVVVLDVVAGQGVVWIQDAASMTNHRQAAPFLSSLPRWLATRGKFLVHAAAVGSPEGVLLLAGVSGSGKSTTALRSLASGLGYAGDDYCLISVEPVPRAISLYGSAKVHWDNLPVVTRLLGRECPALQGGEKALLFVLEAFPERMLTEAPIRALVLPRVASGSPTALRPVPPGVGIKALAPSTLFQVIGPDPRSFAAMAALVRRVPCFALDLGADAGCVPSLLRAALARAH